MTFPSSSYLFYDIETTGLNPCFDQILQFAAIRTDLQLNELERYEWRIKLNPDMTPSPEALKVTGLTLEDCQQGEKEIEVIQRIHKLVNTPGTISLGYNTLSFDDEFLRFSFYRNLLPPYTHQYANHCTRMDIYPITVLYYCFKPDALKWPSKEGRISLKLESINETNQLALGQAHDAMVDVEVTLALARTLKKESSMWDYARGYFQKQTDLKRMNQLSEHELVLLVDGRYGSRDHFLAPALHLGQHRHYKNQSIWLRMDSKELQTSPYVLRKRAGETPMVLPYKTRYIEKLTDERLEQAKQNVNWLNDHPSIFHSLCEEHLEYKYPDVPDIDADAALYQIGFPTPDEEVEFRAFHQALPEEKPEFLSRIRHPIRQEHVLRILGRHYPEQLNADQRAAFKTHLEQRAQAIDYRGQPFQTENTTSTT